MGLQVLDEKKPDGDIEINITGLRPAEKLYEELLIGSNTTMTSHPRIMRAEEKFLSIADLETYLEALGSTLPQRDRSQVRAVLRAVVEGYLPANGIDVRDRRKIGRQFRFGAFFRMKRVNFRRPLSRCA
jgi:FlaA1/EpsC-like NDP-sugar epimerase